MNITNYDINDLVRVAKRLNNPKRSYLYVDPLQGKHIPADPNKALGLCRDLAHLLDEYKGEKLLVIGFAETATAIGAGTAMHANAAAYITTTREPYEGVDYLYFSETHSHATEQGLIISGLEKWVKACDRIVFIDDEITTGNTIMQLIDVIKEHFDYKGKVTILSILNSMTDERLAEMEALGVPCKFLCRIPYCYKSEDIEKHIYSEETVCPPSEVKYKTVTVNSPWDQRFVSSVEDMKKHCGDFIKALNIADPIRKPGSSMLILGTQEFMFLPLLYGSYLENDLHMDVCFHATTRSPIEVCSDEEYPLHVRFRLESLYEPLRTTFIYDLKKYDRCMIFTDAREINEVGLQMLLNALSAQGNDNIVLIRCQ